MKHIVDSVAWQEACNGIRCRECSMLDETGGCRIEKYISRQTVYEERPHGEWEFIGENLFKCTHCGYVADADYLRKWKVHSFDMKFPTACLKCGADMRDKKDDLAEIIEAAQSMKYRSEAE